MARDDHTRRDGRSDSALDGLEGCFYQANVNQAKHEPMPASHDDDRWQEAVRRNQEQHDAMSSPDSPAARGQAVQRLAPDGVRPGRGEPPTQITTARSEDDVVSSARRITRATPGRPDGEVNPGR